MGYGARVWQGGGGYRMRQSRAVPAGLQSEVEGWLTAEVREVLVTGGGELKGGKVADGGSSRR